MLFNRIKGQYQTIFCLLILTSFCTWIGCKAPRQTTSNPTERRDSVELTGTEGAGFIGYYIVDGKKTTLSGILPTTILLPEGTVEFAVQKKNLNEVLNAEIRSGNSYMNLAADGGISSGIRADLIGPSVSTLEPQESLDIPANSLIVIAPYWYEGTWVFDDPQRGLQREPFVEGAPEIINYFVKDIPGAKNGFLLYGSVKPFPGYQWKLHWVRAEDGGNYYKLDDPPMVGWACSALYRYFNETPKVLYVKVEPKK